MLSTGEFGGLLYRTYNYGTYSSNRHNHLKLSLISTTLHPQNQYVLYSSTVRKKTWIYINTMTELWVIVRELCLLPASFFSAPTSAAWCCTQKFSRLFYWLVIHNETTLLNPIECLPIKVEHQLSLHRNVRSSITTRCRCFIE